MVDSGYDGKTIHTHRPPAPSFHVRNESTKRRRMKEKARLKRGNFTGFTGFYRIDRIGFYIV